jgi:glycosyltransferase involved in cell wall biosynthesis
MLPPLAVLQISAFFPAHGGGIEVVAGRIAQGLATRGVCVHWMAGGAAQDIPGGASRQGMTTEWVRSVDFFERRLGLPWPVWGVSGIRSLWRNVGKADVVHVHDYLYFPSLCAVLFARLKKKPVVLTQHIGEIGFKSRYKRLLLQGLNRVIGKMLLQAVQGVAFVGQPVKEYFCGFVTFSRPAVLIENGVDHERFHPAPRPPCDGLSFLFVGRFVEKKGIQFLRSCTDLAGVEWNFVGWGPLSPTAWGAASAAVRVHEHVRGDAVIPFFQQADLLVLPSTGEGFPLVLQEALACGTPVLVSDEVKAAFSSVDAACVFSVDMAHPDANILLRKQLELLAASPQLLADGRAAALKLSQQWSWEVCVEAYIRLYQRVLPLAER